jgi:AbrB family looped-hinge helix DNA binding protein
MTPLLKTKLSTKGQLILPKAVRDRHGWQAGVELTVEDLESGVLIRAEKKFPETRIEDLIGCAGYQGPPRSLEDMEAGIRQGALARS